jgi:hypothetical protein
MIAQITKTANGYEIILDGQTLSVPEAAGNRHYQMVLDAIADGQPVLDPPAPPLPTADQVRTERDQLLAKTDWMALSDNTLTPDWATYRQALRDVTAQEGFPYSVIWPTKPE